MTEKCGSRAGRAVTLGALDASESRWLLLRCSAADLHIIAAEGSAHDRLVMSRSEQSAGRRWRECLALGLGLSVLANVVLGVRLILPTDVNDGSSATREVTHSERVAIGVPPLATTRPLPKDIPQRAPFVWRDVEDEDYRVYIANLRAVGCPEVMIRDLVAAELAQSFKARATAPWRPRKLEYWRKFEPAQDDQGQADLSRYKMLMEEHDAVLEELFGSKHIQDEWFALRDLQLRDSERSLAFLPEPEHQAAVRALALARLDEAGLEMRNGTEVDRDTLFKLKLDALSQVLSPAELDEFRMRSSPGASAVRGRVHYFDCTVEEFRELVDAQEAGIPLAFRVEELFGLERAAEFERVSHPYYQNLRRALDDAGYPPDYAESAWNVFQETQLAATEVAGRATSSAADRAQQLEELRIEAERRFDGLLGEHLARVPRRDLAMEVHRIGRQLNP